MVRQDRPSQYAIADMQLIRGKHASLVAVIPPNSLVLHAPSCWSDATWDEVSSNYATQIWYLPRYDKSRRSGVCTTAPARSDMNLPFRIQHKLGKWDSRQYDFYSSVDDPPRPLQCYRVKQQDACQYSHDGPLAATDGSPAPGRSVWAPALSSSRNLDLQFRYNSRPCRRTVSYNAGGSGRPIIPASES